MLERYENRNTDFSLPPKSDAEADEPAPAVDAAEPVDREAAEDPIREAGVLEEDALAAMPLKTDERDEEPEVVAEDAPAEIEVEVIDEAPVPEIEVEVIEDKKTIKKAKARKKKKTTEDEDAPSKSFLYDDVPNHFADDAEPLSFKFFEPNEEEGDPAQFLAESEEQTQFAPVPEDAERKNGRLPLSEDRAPADSTWIVRPVVSSTPAKAADAAEGNASPSDEIDKIRRILSDLD